MKVCVLLFALFIAGPLLAQQQPECRSNTQFNLGNGTSGCLIDIRESQFTKTLRRDDGQVKSNARIAAIVEVRMSGAFSRKQAISTPRMKAVCSLFAENAKAALPNTKVRSIIVVMRWPYEVSLPNSDRKIRYEDRDEIHAAAMTPSCRSIKYLK